MVSARVRGSEIALLREAHAAEILRRDREFQGLVRSADERLEEYQQWREQSDAERARLEMHLRQHEAACADLRLRLDRADADRAAQQQVAERAQGDYDGLATRVGEVTARLEAMLERTRQDAGEAGRRVAVLEAALAVERSRANAVRGPRQPRTSSGGTRQ